MQTAGGIPNYNDYFELSSSKTTLLVIDPQNDFHPGGSLAIANANQDAGRIAKLIKTNAPAIDDVIVSLDTHQRMHVAHGLFWINEAGEHPAPFTPITEADVTAGVWKTTDPKWQTWGMEYVQKLEANNRFVLLIWPEVRHFSRKLPVLVQSLKETGFYVFQLRSHIPSHFFKNLATSSL